MKLSVVYKSPKKADTFLYVEKRDDFSRVPEALMKQFGQPQLVMLLALSKHDKVANIDTSKFKEKLMEDGFYLQLPPKEKSLLASHREALGLNSANKP